MTEKTPTQRSIDAILANALHEAAQHLRALELEGPYVNLTGFISDGRGCTCGDINRAYADWLDSVAKEITA